MICHSEFPDKGQRVLAVYYIYLTLNDWSRGEQWILFRENLNDQR